MAELAVTDSHGLIWYATGRKRKLGSKAYPVGVEHVLVNGIPVIRDGEHTGAKPGKAVRGAAYAPR